MGAPLDLAIGDTSNVAWLPGGGLDVHTLTTLLSPGPASKVIDACMASDEVSLEAWSQPVNDTQSLSRIIALAGNRNSRNAMLAQACTERSECDSDRYQLRVRTSDTDDEGNPNFQSASGTVVTDQPQHVVYTRDSAGNEAIYLDGVLAETGTRAGTLDN